MTMRNKRKIIMRVTNSISSPNTTEAEASGKKRMGFSVKG
jgi:hypothetical protein